MSRRTRIRMVSILIIWIFLCVIFTGVVEAAEVKERNNVKVYFSETEIIESTLTDKWHNRKFNIENGQYEIIYTIWGSNDDENWEFWESGTLEQYESTVHIMGTNHFWYIKLTGSTIEMYTPPSNVNASLTYHIP